MNPGRISVRYAKALFELALEQKAVESIYEDMRTIEKLCSMEEVKEVINNPVIPQKKREEIIITLAGKTHNLTVKFVELIFSHGRGNQLGAAARYFIDLTRRHRGIREVTLTTAVPVDDKLKQELAEIVTGQGKGKIEFNEQVDGSIIGGFILKVDDAYIDASVRERLNRFRKEFLLAGSD